jgi:predicted metal-dependent RNase
MNLTFSGGAYEVGASCILLKIDNKNILMDCGIRQSSSKDTLPDFRIIQENGGVDAIIISHAHMDHTGALPLISKEYPFAKIYMNNMTKDLVRVLLYDSLKIMSSREAEVPLYGENDVMNMLDRIHTLNYQVEFSIFEGIKITFYNAGHIAGASCTYITSKEGSVFYSGDFSIFPQKSIEGAKIPKLRPDAAIFEATYGDKLHRNRELEEERLLDLVRECIEKNGKMLIPAFALGRAQELILILKKAMNNKKLKKVKVYIDGMVKDINLAYIRNPLYLKSSLGKKILKGTEAFYDENIIAVSNKEDRENILKAKESCVIISSSGMLTGGPSQYYAEILAGMEEGYIVLSGYQDEEAPGRKLLELIDKEEKILEINSKSIPVKCRIEKVGLSAHGDKQEIKALIETLSPKNIFLVHGEGSVIDGLAKEVQESYIGRVYTPKGGESIDIIIRNPRKQLMKNLSYKLNRKDELTYDNISELWKFVRDCYNDRLFTAEELELIWKGDSEVNEIEELQRLLLNNPYFENDNRRFFMFRAKTVQDVEEALKPKELNQNEIMEIVQNKFSEYNYKKISYIIQSKKVVLNFDFPKTVPSEIYEGFQKFKEETCWNIEINAQTNMNELDNELKILLGQSNIKKISHNINESKVLVQVYEEADYLEAQALLKAKTGFELMLKNEKGATESILDASTVIKSSNSEIMEQNAAIACIDQVFKYEEFKPYKKSIREKGSLELAFISPKIGKRYMDIIVQLAEATGWNISLSNSVNQNEILSMAVRLCRNEDIVLQKNPSFNAALLEVVIKPLVIEEDKLTAIKENFDYNTGCSLKWS